MREDEELCQQAVDRFLRERGVQPKWERGTRNRPPDYFVSIGERGFAVEVTSIHGSTGFDGRDWPWPGLTHELARSAESICREVQSRVPILGTYELLLPSMPKLKEHQGCIVQKIVTYFERNALQAAEMQQTVVAQPEGRDVRIWKVRAEGSALIPAWLPAGGLVTHRDDQLKTLLEETIGKKIGKLRNIAKPWVLVIRDAYLFQGTLDEWRSRLPSKVSEFAAFLRIQGDAVDVVYEETGRGACRFVDTSP